MTSEERVEDDYDAQHMRGDRDTRSRLDEHDRSNDSAPLGDRYPGPDPDDGRNLDDSRHDDADFDGRGDDDRRNGTHDSSYDGYDGGSGGGQRSGHGGGGGGGSRSGGPPDISETVSLLVLNLSFGTSAHSLRGFFQEFGELADVYIPRNRETGVSRGFAFVRYYTKEEAERAIDAMNGKTVDNRQIQVQFARYGRQPLGQGGHRGRGGDSFRGGGRYDGPRDRYGDGGRGYAGGPYGDRYGGGDRLGDRYTGGDRHGDRYAGDRYGNDRVANDRYGMDRYGSDRHGGDRYGGDRYGGDRYGSDRYGGGRYGGERSDGGDRYGYDRYSDARPGGGYGGAAGGRYGGGSGGRQSSERRGDRNGASGPTADYSRNGGRVSSDRYDRSWGDDRYYGGQANGSGRDMDGFPGGAEVLGRHPRSPSPRRRSPIGSRSPSPKRYRSSPRDRSPAAFDSSPKTSRDVPP